MPGRAEVAGGGTEREADLLRGPAGVARPAEGGPARRRGRRPGGDGAGGLVPHDQVVIRAGTPAQLDGHAAVTPGGQPVVGLPRPPRVQAVAGVVERAAPVALGDVAGAGETEDVARRLAA